jgi:tetratricopeptide (TPR) repeat protein
LPINSDVPPGEAFPKATDAAEKAISLAPDLADAHIALGYVASWYDHDWQKAEMEFKKAIEDAPNNPDAHRGYSILLTCLGHHDQAIAEMERARELDPLSLITNALEGQTFLFAGRYDSAIERLNKTFEIDPNFWVAHIQLARVYIQQNKLDDAIAEAEKAKQYSGGNSESFSLAGFAKAKAGRQEQASNDLEILKAMQIKGMVTYYNTAAIYNGLGQSDEAIASLEKAVEARDVRLVLLKVDPKWDNLRSDPRFTALMKRLNFVE